MKRLVIVLILALLCVPAQAAMTNQGGWSESFSGTLSQTLNGSFEIENNGFATIAACDIDINGHGYQY